MPWRKRFCPASEEPRKLHGRMIKLLYGHRKDSQVTPLGTYVSDCRLGHIYWDHRDGSRARCQGCGGFAPR